MVCFLLPGFFNGQAVGDEKDKSNQIKRKRRKKKKMKKKSSLNVMNWEGGQKSTSEGVTEKVRGREKRRIGRQQDQTHCLLSLRHSGSLLSSQRVWGEINR